MVKIRLARSGAKKRPFYHVIATDRRAARDGRFIERLGFYNPNAKGGEHKLVVDAARITYWKEKGAQVSERVEYLVKTLPAAGKRAQRLTEDHDARVVEVGRVSGLFGVRGWVKIHSYTRPLEQIFRYGPWQLKASAAECEVEVLEGRIQGRGLVARLRRAKGAEIEDRDAAALLVGASIAVRRSALEAPPPGSYYWADLVGLRVQSVSGADLGRVKRLVENGAQDVLVIEDGEVERLIPFVREAIVQSVDLEAGVIVVAWEPDY